MTRPPGKQPHYVDEDGTEWPLIVPPAMLDEAQKRFPKLWIVANQPIKRIGWPPA